MPLHSLFNTALQVCIAHSANPLLAGWQGEAVMCLTKKLFHEAIDKWCSII